MTTVATILLSYNRPRMLREATRSLAAAQPNQVILVDDGSDFDPLPLLAPFAVLDSVLAPKLTTEERLVTARLGRLINQALDLVTADIVTYLCDDDLFHPGWLSAVRSWFDANGAEHWTRGTWYQFQDGATPGTDPCPLDARQLTTGNFAHRKSCFTQCGWRWNESSVACHDDMMLWDVQRFHNTYSIPDSGAVAGWRRLHARNALSYVAGAHYAPWGPRLFENGWLE
jgi:glycosyltransferase involved in cell wall biosynthesis